MTSKAPPIRVSKDDRLIIPKEIVRKQGLTAGDLVERSDVVLRKSGVSRRSVLKLFKAGLEVLAITGASIEIRSLIKEVEHESEESDRKLLNDLFGAINGSPVSIAPARHHPFMPLAAGSPGYPIEVDSANSYISRVYGRVDNVEPAPQSLCDILPSDNVAVFGSQVSNFIAREILGDPFTPTPVTKVPVPKSATDLQCSALHQQDTHGRGFMSLRWNMIADANAPSRFRKQYGRSWEYKPHLIFDCKSGDASRPEDDRQDDVLIVTVVPRDQISNTRVVIFGGLHGAGTLATALLLTRPPHGALQDLHQVVRNAPYYQALFAVKCRDGRPESVRLSDAEVLSFGSERPKPAGKKPAATPHKHLRHHGKHHG